MLENLDSFIIKSASGAGGLPCYTSHNEADICEFANSSKASIKATILKYGGILLRGFSIRSLSEFNKLSNIISPSLLDYQNRSTPRTKLGGKIYTSTEYPKDKRIPFHNENSYTNNWPELILFFSVIPAEEGGETATTDSRLVLQNIDQDIIDEFESKLIKYKRNYSKNLDLDWREVFQTSERQEVERYCNDNNIQFKWHDSGNIELSTEQICQAIVKHPQTNAKVWFNQAHLFNVSSMPGQDSAALIDMVGGKENLPRNSYYGDGTELPKSYLEKIFAAYEKERIEFKWERGDVMILDNLLMSHSRNPFTGNRKVAVSMGKW